MQPTVLDLIATGVFALAILHTFAAKRLERVASRSPRHAGIFHLLSEVEVVFGFWAIVLMAVLAVFQGADEVVNYVESRNYTEPLFVFAIMVVAASRPIVSAVANVIDTLSRWLPLPIALAQAWLGLAAVPLLGSLITEPAAMTIAALLLAPIAFRRDIPEPRKYLAIGVLFVNISIGGTLSSYAAPPILMVAETWGWTTPFMLATFGWKAALAVALNATIAVVVLRRHLSRVQQQERAIDAVPMPIVLVHFALLAGIVVSAHHPAIFIGLLLMFLGIAHAYERHQTPLILREALLVGFFLAGLVVLGGLQRWWLQPVIGSLDDLQLFVGALSLTAITDNAALTYLGSLSDQISDDAKYWLVAGAVAGGGLTVIANAPNPAGASLLEKGFTDETISAGGLLAGALLPTAIAAAAFGLL
ncbi:putative Na+/H+ antiporter [Lysobacter soli]|uniref:putative Na+/H+ antiporter n=1 Tax=Lysobacter soli TaxID=453783 RepID=UPI00209DA9F5|nr:putative Na+/H+ antiporter [Lysobacter soli]UTA55096.1 putative Na+/H+ antiporter [Lysobacter soli]